MHRPFRLRFVGLDSAIRHAVPGSLILVMVLVLSALAKPSHTAPAPELSAAPQHATAPPAAQAPATGDIARGEYLANSVAMCVQCHSSRDPRGVIIPNEKFKGASMPVRGPSWSVEWAYRTPALAGLPGFTNEQIVMLLTEGHAGDRPAPKPPMPPFRMTKADAEAVVAYLRSR